MTFVACYSRRSSGEGGTVYCVSNLILSRDKEVSGLVTVVELSKLKGRSKFNFPVESSITL